MLRRMRLEQMRIRLHGADSSLTLLAEDDETFKKLAELRSDFTVTRQRSSSQGAYIDKLSARLDTAKRIADFDSADAFDLRIRNTVTRYRIDDKSRTPQETAMFGFADAVMIRNDDTAIEA